jgi:hypothetical protein
VVNLSDDPGAGPKLQQKPAGWRWGLPAGTASFLSHPLTLLISGAVISSILIPFISHDWQVHAEELEVKDELVEEINDSLVTFVMKMRFDETDQSLQAAYSEWAMEKERINTKIRVFFQDKTAQGTELHRDWDEYSTKITHLYQMTKEGRADLEAGLETHFSTDGLEILADATPSLSPEGYHEVWENLLDKIILKKSEIVEDVIEGNTSL